MHIACQTIAHFLDAKDLQLAANNLIFLKKMERFVLFLEFDLI